jgi:ABC-type branched-subunit amino acid transport system substrate-binding protein
MKVGLLLPQQVPSGYESKVGAEMAISEINAAGGILGRKVELVPADDQSNPTAAVSEVRRLAEIEKVEAVLGTVISQNILAISPILVRANIVNFGVAGSDLITPQSAPNFFSSYYNSTVQAEAMFNFAVGDLKAKSIGVLAESGAQAKSGVEVIRALAQTAGVTVTGEQQFDPRAPDFTPQLLSLKRGNPDVVLFWLIQQEDVVTFLKNMKEIGWDVQVAASGVGAAGAKYVVNAIGPNQMKNIHGTLLRLNTYCPGEPVGKSSWTGFLDRIKAFAPKDYDKLNPGNVIMLYNAAYIMKAGMEGAGSTDPKKISAYLESNEIKIPTGVGKASAKGHFMVGAGDIVPVSDPDLPRDDGLIRRAKCS